jgi:hypothetical protein
MTKPFNPSKFVDMLGKRYYATGPKGDELKGEREGLVAWLRKKGKNSRACLDLADKLAQCRRRHRCKSAACPECATAGQRLMADVARRFLKDQSGDGVKIACVTIIPADGMTAPGGLDAAEHGRAIRRWKEKLAKAGVEAFVGATDVSFNEDKQSRHAPMWSQHIYGITVTKRLGKLKRKLKMQFLKTDEIRRPVKAPKWDGDKQALRYILKPNFWRRIETNDGQRHDPKTGTTRSCRDTDTQPLKSRHKRKLLVYLDRLGMQGRLLMRWCQLLNAKDGPMVMLRRPKGSRSR